MLRRLLLASSGAGSFTAPPAPATVINISAAPYGTGTDIQWPLATRLASGLVVFGIIQGEDDPNDVGVIAYDPDTDTMTGPVELWDQLNEGSSTTPDTHNQPAVAELPDGRVMVAVVGHQASTIRVWTFDTPGGISGGVTGPVEITSSYTLTYVQLGVMSTGRVYLRVRGLNGGQAEILQWYSDDAGETWDIGTRFFTAETNNIYSAFVCDGEWIDQIIVPRAADYAPGWPMLHVRSDADGAVYRSDGTEITGFSYPLAVSDLTEVFADGTKRNPRGLTPVPGDLPVVAWDSAQANPVLMGESIYDAGWEAETVATSVPVYSFASSTGGNKHAYNNPNLMFYGKVLGSDPVDDGGSIEMFRSEKTAGVWDGGTQITFDGENPYGPFPIANNDDSLVIAWTVGDQAPADGDPFSLRLQGIAT